MYRGNATKEKEAREVGSKITSVTKVTIYISRETDRKFKATMRIAANGGRDAARKGVFAVREEI